MRDEEVHVANTEHRQTPPDETVREEDLEPYVALRYIARLFKVLAALIVVMLLGEVALGVIIDKVLLKKVAKGLLGNN